MIILWLQTATCFLLALFLFMFFFFCGTFNIQACNAIYVWVMRFQSLEINYHTAPNNKSTALPILQKLISMLVCLLGRAEFENGCMFWSQLGGWVISKVIFLPTFQDCWSLFNMLIQ